jgi:hypothetical protein
MKTIPYIDNQFLINALGGEEEVVKLGEVMGIDLRPLLWEGEINPYHKGYILYHCRDFYFKFLNFANDNFYPDIRIIFYSPVRIEGIPPRDSGHETMCENIGLNETMDEAKIRANRWFNEEFYAVLLESKFT